MALAAEGQRGADLMEEFVGGLGGLEVGNATDEATEAMALGATETAVSDAPTLAAGGLYSTSLASGVGGGPAGLFPAAVASPAAPPRPPTVSDAAGGPYPGPRTRLRRILIAAEVADGDADISFTRLRQTLREAFEDLLEISPPPGLSIPQMLDRLEAALGLPPLEAALGLPPLEADVM
jgi:hypothetical protein